MPRRQTRMSEPAWLCLAMIGQPQIERRCRSDKYRAAKSIGRRLHESPR
jgi:hypothetical protein